ncbi:MAG: hypothetical protein A3G87_03995 [Omnitrophica bacterium RIFCSPLOWO2_12_FULL_50_11]|nr:MAG: hypothetical protein A3G87_03995 [Omnitrophica bacterium RIFCSPLOWO2_12_FULL_50_11]
MLHLQHNVVSILCTIKGMIECHGMKTKENLFRTREEALKHARSVMKRIYHQADRALLITKHISVAMKAEPDSDDCGSEVSVKDVWREVVDTFKRRYSFESLEVLDHVSAEYPPIRCSHNDLMEIFYILVENAVQAMNQKGKLIIRANLQFSKEDYPLAVITVSDTGPGIPEDILSRLFEPFFTTKSLEEGSGLGLCLVKNLAKRNGGSVTASSFKGCGTTFTLSFSVARLGRMEKQSPLAYAA